MRSGHMLIERYDQGIPIARGAIQHLGAGIRKEDHRHRMGQLSVVLPEELLDGVAFVSHAVETGVDLIDEQNDLHGIGCRGCGARKISADGTEGGNRLRLLVVLYSEIVLLQARDGLAGFIGHDDIERDVAVWIADRRSRPVYCVRQIGRGSRILLREYGKRECEEEDPRTTHDTHTVTCLVVRRERSGGRRAFRGTMSGLQRSGDALDGFSPEDCSDERTTDSFTTLRNDKQASGMTSRK